MVVRRLFRGVGAHELGFLNGPGAILEPGPNRPQLRRPHWLTLAGAAAQRHSTVRPRQSSPIERPGRVVLVP